MKVAADQSFFHIYLHQDTPLSPAHSTPKRCKLRHHSLTEQTQTQQLSQNSAAQLRTRQIKVQSVKLALEARCV